MNNYYIEQDLQNVHIKQLREPTDRYNSYGDRKSGWLEVQSNERKSNSRSVSLFSAYKLECE